MEEVTLQNFFYIPETCKVIFLSPPDKLLQEEKLLWSTLQLYIFKWIWWSQNLRTWKACAYCVVGLQDLNSSSEGNTVQSNIWDRTDSIITEVTVLGPHSIHTVSFYIHWIRSKRTQIRQRGNNQGLHFYSQGTAWQTCILEVPK